MPLYDYKCPKCTVYHEVIHGMADATTPTCPIHGVPMEKALQSPAGLRVQGGTIPIDSPYESVHRQHGGQKYTAYTPRGRR